MSSNLSHFPAVWDLAHVKHFCGTLSNDVWLLLEDSSWSTMFWLDIVTFFRLLTGEWLLIHFFEHFHNTVAYIIVFCDTTFFSCWFFPLVAFRLWHVIYVYDICLRNRVYMEYTWWYLAGSDVLHIEQERAMFCFGHFWLNPMVKSRLRFKWRYLIWSIINDQDNIIIVLHMMPLYANQFWFGEGLGTFTSW